MELQGFGNGSDGPLTISSNTTEAPIDSSCSGSVSSQSLSATNALFSNDQLIMIHQTRGTGAGSWEFNFIDTYVAGTITTQFPLVNTYTDSGASQAQVRVVPQYSKVVIQSGAAYKAKDWNQNVGGILSFLVAGEFINEGTVHINGGSGASVQLNNSVGGRGTGGGFYGGYAHCGTGTGQGYQGEGTGGAGGQTYSANGNGGGGGWSSSAPGANPGGGGGNGTAGQDGNKDGPGEQGRGGAVSGNANLSLSMTFGGGGGGGGRESVNNAGGGGAGGGIILIWAESITTNVGSIQSIGGNGGNVSDRRSGGGGGAGGSIYLRAVQMTIGSNRIVATGGSGDEGGVGGNGRIRLEACSISGSTTQGSVSQVVGGFDFCQTMIHIYG